MNNTDSNITIEELVGALKTLPKGKFYSYINTTTKTLVAIESIESNLGPIYIKRYDPSEEETPKNAKIQSISTQMLSRVANAMTENTPINIDRLLGASYNTRSALEALLCHTPQFYYCFPGRIEIANGKTKIRSGHKHIIYLPNDPHALGELVEKEIKNMEINEIPSKNVIYNALELPAHEIPSGKVDTTEERIHLNMQMAIYEIGCNLGVKTFIAKNDQGAMYKGKLLSEHDCIITDLKNVPVVGAFDGAEKAGRLIDAIWLDSKSIPAIFEVENSTGVTSGLTRMINFKKTLPPYSDMRFIIIAPDDLSDKVSREVNKPEFVELHALYLPYSAVSELLGLCQERTLKGVSTAFIETYCEDLIK